MIRRLGARYLFVLVAVATLIVVDQAVIQPLLLQLDRFAPVINLAGRQRMLSQRLTKSALIIERSTSPQMVTTSRHELQATLQQWQTANSLLQAGDREHGINLITSPAIREQWQMLKPHFSAMITAAQTLVDSSENPLNGTGKAAVETIVSQEAQFLAIMDHIVKLMESEAAREVQRLRALALAIAGSIVALIVGLGWFVVRPATRTIRSQVDQLENRVSERTEELATTLTSLEREVAEREIVESKNQRLAAQLAHADRVESIGHLAVGLAHELNHPLGVIVNYAEACDVLLNRTEEQAQRGKLADFIVKIREASLRAGNIVRRMRNFVQPNTADAVEVDIRALIEEIVALCRPEIEKNEVSLLTELGKEAVLVSVDVIQIQQVLVNLVQNALQAMVEIPAEKRRLKIHVTPVDDLARIDVVDTGPGLKPNDAHTIFEPFHSTKPDGLGVGLSICRSIIENHRGTIWAEPSPNQGATVSFTLPIISPHAARRSLQSYSLCC